MMRVQGHSGDVSSFGELISATGGGATVYTSTGAGGIPNGYGGTTAEYTQGFELSFEKIDGEFGRGGGPYGDFAGAPFYSGGSGGYDSQYITVAPNTTYEVKVGKGGAAPTDWENYGRAGVSGFVLIAYGEIFKKGRKGNGKIQICTTVIR